MARSWSVTLAMALTTTTGFCSRRPLTIAPARSIALASCTEVPPNFMTMQLLDIGFQSAAFSDQGSPDGQCHRARNNDAANAWVAETTFLQNRVPNGSIDEFFGKKDKGCDAWKQEYREKECILSASKKSGETQEEKDGREFGRGDLFVHDLKQQDSRPNHHHRGTG